MSIASRLEEKEDDQERKEVGVLNFISGNHAGRQAGRQIQTSSLT